jgi:predicted Zn-dependent protease with MMP-like domain
VPLARLDQGSVDGTSPRREARPARIVLYRRPLLARAEGDEELGELVLDIVVEEFARLLGLDPQVVDPGYPGDDD